MWRGCRITTSRYTVHPGRPRYRLYCGVTRMTGMSGPSDTSDPSSGDTGTCHLADDYRYFGVGVGVALEYPRVVHANP